MSDSKYSSKKEYNETNPWRHESTLRDLYCKRGMSLIEIAEKFDVSHQTILYWCKKHGIDRRDNLEYADERFENESAPPVRTNQQMIFCACCGEMFTVAQHEVGERKFCSQECARDGYHKSDYKSIRLKCQNCSKVFKALPERKFCSHECYWEDLYEGGSTLNDLYRKKEKIRGWRKSVYERDNFTCQRCGDSGGSLNAHHITPVSSIVDEIDKRDEITDHELFNDISNGITLCIDCHDKIHTADGRTEVFEA